MQNECLVLRRRLKVWESSFEQEHRRKPTKSDITKFPQIGIVCLSLSLSPFILMDFQRTSTSSMRGLKEFSMKQKYFDILEHCFHF